MKKRTRLQIEFDAEQEYLPFILFTNQPFFVGTKLKYPSTLNSRTIEWLVIISIAI